MKYKWLFVVLFLVFNKYGYTQVYNIDTKAKYILSFGLLTMITEENGKLYLDYFQTHFNSLENKPEFYFEREKKSFSTIEELLVHYNISKDDLIELTDLKEEKSETIIDDLKQKQFYVSYRNRKINVIDNENAIIRYYTENQILSNSFLVKLYPITINKKYTFFNIEKISSKYHEGYIIALKNKYIINSRGGFFASEIMSKKDSSDIRNEIGMQYEKGIFYKENNKYGLKSKSGNQVLIRPVYDSIYYYGQFVAGKKGNLLQMHYKNGERLNIPNIRAIMIHNGDYGNYGVLVNNQTYWLDNGAIVDSLLNRRSVDVCGFVPQIVLSIVKEKDNFYQGGYGYGNDSKEKILCSSNKLKSVSFLNQQTKIETNSYNDFFVKNLLSTNSYIVETLDNNKSIAKFNDGKIEYVLKPDKYTFTYINDRFLRFELKGLYGLYPFHKKAKYTKLSSFTKGFARFELPNGKKGWLAMDGKEYLDN